ncbi:MAG TPA: tetratricopeptide repeat protein [Phycisphaerae bacterium]|nr:tetratricopeptide repeat protein [Phycisphaerae bacterium]
MSEDEKNANASPCKGKAFFDRADEVADTGNWDFAIEMYVEGLRREPDNLQRGHKKLREVSLKRKVQGGKGPGTREQIKRRAGKDPLENLTNASYLLAKEPGQVKYMEQLLKAATELDLSEVIRWTGEILLETQKQAKKPNKRICLIITDALDNAGHYDLAILACNLAILTAPDDPELESRLGQLGAKYTIWKGKYGQEGDFSKSIKDIDEHKRWMQQDMLVKDDDYLKQQIAQAEEEYRQSPTVAGKINAFIDALLKFEDEAYENQAIDVLNKAHKDTSAYQFKMRVGEIRIRQMSRQFRKLREAGDNEGATNLAREQLEFETAEYAERAENYPTDLSIKYELGRRLFLSGKYDDAIGILQQAQRDPRHFVTAMNYLGQGFMKKNWWQEAIETFDKVLAKDLTERRAIDVRYNLALCYEQMNNLQMAQKQFSQVAQIDFNYKDARTRLEAVRKKIEQSDSQS